MKFIKKPTRWFCRTLMEKGFIKTENDADLYNFYFLLPLKRNPKSARHSATISITAPKKQWAALSISGRRTEKVPSIRWCFLLPLRYAPECSKVQRPLPVIEAAFFQLQPEASGMVFSDLTIICRCTYISFQLPENYNHQCKRITQEKTASTSHGSDF